jgi:hypothetical protein
MSIFGKIGNTLSGATGGIFDTAANVPFVGSVVESLGLGKDNSTKAREALIRQMKEQQLARYRLAYPAALSYQKAMEQSMLPYRTTHQFAAAMLGMPNQPYLGDQLSQSPFDMAMLQRDPVTGQPLTDPSTGQPMDPSAQAGRDPKFAKKLL